MGEKRYNGRNPGGTRRPGKSGSTHNVRPLSSGGGSASGGHRSKGVKGGMSSSVTGPIRVAVFALAAFTLAVPLGVVGFIVWGYAA